EEPVSLKALLQERGLAGREVSDDEKKGLVRALGHRVMWGINRASTVTPHALLAAALLAHRRRGISEKEVSERIVFLRRIATELGAPFSKLLEGAPSSPTALWPIAYALRMFEARGMVTAQLARGQA